MLRKILILFLLCAPSWAQLTVDAIINLKNTSPSAPTTQLTATILGNGTIGNSMTSGWSITGTGSALTVGTHDPRCSILGPLQINSTTYNFELPSQPISLNAASNFTYAQNNFPSSKQHVVISGCVTFGGNGSTNSLMDMFAVLALNGGGGWMQQTTGSCIEIESDHNSTHHSPCINASGQGPFRVLFGVDYSTPFPGVGSSGTAQLALFSTTFPYNQITCSPVGAGCTSAGTVSIDVKNTAQAGSLAQFRVGNAEVGVASGKSLNFEMLSFDYVGSFPASAGSIGTPWEGILSSSRGYDWTHGGVVGGIPARTTICQTLSSGATASQINTAITNCPTGQTVFLNPGTYNVGAITWGNTSTVKNGVTLRGSGADQTFLIATGNMGSPCSVGGTFICMASPDNNFKSTPSNTANWTSGYLAGSNVITLSTVNNLRIGNFVILDQLDDTCDSGGIIASDSTATCTPTSPGISGPYVLEGNSGNFPRSGRNQTEEATVVGCNGSTTIGTLCTGTNVAVTISPALRLTWRSSQTPGAWWPTTPVHDNGIENLSIDAAAVAGTAFQVKNGYNNWTKGVRLMNTDRAEMQCVYGVHNEFRDSYGFLTQNSLTQSYGWDGNVCSDNKIENNIFQAVEGPIKENGDVGDAIFGNTARNLYYVQPGWAQPSQSDHSWNAFILNEMNMGKGHEWDVFHMTHALDTDFRNWYIGKPPACYASGSSYATSSYAACDNNLHALRIESFARGMNIIGNVLGATGLGFSYAGAQPNIYEIGQGNTEGSVTVPNDAITGTTLFRWFNWDAVNQNSRCQSSEVPNSLTAGTQQVFLNFVPANCSAPASLLYTTQPAWWTGVPWPPIGPDVTGGNVANVGGHVYKTPADLCADLIGINANGTNGAQNFNAARCYGGGGVSPPTSPAVSLFASFSKLVSPLEAY